MTHLIKKYDREWILENLEEARPNTIYSRNFSYQNCNDLF